MSKKLIMMTIKKTKRNSRCVDYMAIKLLFDKMKHKSEDYCG